MSSPGMLFPGGGPAGGGPAGGGPAGGGPAGGGPAGGGPTGYQKSKLSDGKSNTVQIYFSELDLKFFNAVSPRPVPASVLSYWRAG